MTDSPIERAKQAAGKSAADHVTDGDVVGLGSGTTAAYAIAHLGERVADGLDITGIPTSTRARRHARAADIPLTTLDTATPDIAIDGADQVVDTVLVKGGGGSHLREKLVAAAADDVHIVCDHTKLSETLDHPIPLSILIDARVPVEDAVRALGGTPTLRCDDDNSVPILTENGAHILDCEFGKITQPDDLAQELATIPGTLDHGLFINMIDTLHCADGDTVTISQP